MGVIDLDLKSYSAISTQNSRKHHSMSLTYIDLGRPRGVSSPNMLLLNFESLSFYVDP